MAAMKKPLAAKPGKAPAFPPVKALPPAKVVPAKTTPDTATAAAMPAPAPALRPGLMGTPMAGGRKPKGKK